MIALLTIIFLASTAGEPPLPQPRDWTAFVSDSFDKLDKTRWTVIDGDARAKSGSIRLEKNARVAYVGPAIPAGPVLVRFTLNVPVDKDARSQQSIFAPISPVYEYDWGLVVDIGRTTVELSLDGTLVYVWNRETNAADRLAFNSAARIPVAETHTVTILQSADTISVWLDEHFALAAVGAPNFDGGFRIGSWRNRILVDDLVVRAPRQQ